MPMLVRELSDDAVLEMQLVENIEREDLDPMEEAEGFELLRGKLGYSVEQIAERIGRGKGASYVYKTLKLCALTPASREAMYDGTLGRSTGLLVARYQPEQQAEVVEFIKGLARGSEPAPFRDVQPQLARHFHLVLEDAPWDLNDGLLVAIAGACSACPKRSGNQGDIFGDAGAADSCTDAICFDSKRLAHVEGVKAQAAKDGFKLLDDDECRRAKYYPGNYIIGYTDVDDTAYTEKGNDGTERVVTFADALRAMGKKAPKPRILIDPHTSQPIKVISNELALELRPKDEDDDQPATRRRGRAGDDEIDDRTPEEKALGQSDVRRAVLLRMFEAVRSTPRTMAEMQAVALHLYLSAFNDGLDQLDKYLGWETELIAAQDHEVPALVKAKIDAMVPEQLDQFIAMVTIEVDFAGYDAPGSAARVALATRYGIDVLAVRDKIADDVARREAGDSQADPIEPEAAIGSRVRIKEGIKGPNGHFRKICGREGVLGPHMGDTWTVKFEGKESARAKRDEFIVLPDAEIDPGLHDALKATIDPVAAWPFPIASSTAAAA
jgi:hypothetical protein